MESNSRAVRIARVTRSLAAPMPRGGRGILIALSIIFLASLLLSLPGCASSSKYVPCCKRDGIINTSANPQVIYGSPSCNFAEGGRYGGCEASTFANGTIKCLPDAEQCNKPLAQCTKTIGCVWDANSSGCRTLRCSDLSNNQSCTAARCMWDGIRCAPGGAAAYVAMSVCVDSAPSSCTNEKCSVMLCGYKKLVPAPPISSSDWNNGSAQPAPAADQQEAINLLGTSCTFKKMTEKTYNSVKNSRGALWANAFRFGVGSSFLDFEAARFFFPLSDRFCTGGVPGPGARDRFIVYVNATSTWCAPRNNFVTCAENGQNFTDFATCTGYCRNPFNCHDASGTGFRCIETETIYSNQTKCKSDCGIVQNPKACSLDPAKYPFLEPDSRYKTASDGAWALDYSHYQTVLESQYGMDNSMLYEYECETSADCISGYCDHSSHIRGLCVNATDSLKRVDCGCRSQQVGSGTILNCSNALSGYTIYRSVIAANLNGRSTGGYGQAGGDWLFNPYNNAGRTTIPLPPPIGPVTVDSPRDNEIQKVEGGVLFSQGSGGNLGNVGSQDNKTYRFYVLDDGTKSPPKLFQNCGIKRSEKEALYSAYRMNESVPIWSMGFQWGTGTLPAALPDGYGPGSVPMCYYKFQKHDIHCGGDDTDQYMDGLLPMRTDGTCPYLNNGDIWPGTGTDHCVTCWTGKYCYTYTAWQTAPIAKYWIYELSFDENSNRLGECSLIGDRVPYFNARDIGWCEGCTYSTLAPQTVSDSNYGSIADKVNSRMPLYMQANIMPIMDIRNTTLSEYYSEEPYCAGGYFDFGWLCQIDPNSCYMCSQPGTLYHQWTEYAGLALCQNNSGAALYTVSDLSGIGDRSAPSSSRGTANAVEDPVAKNTLLLSYLTPSNALVSGHTVTFNGYGAALWKSQLLKGSCPNQPLAAIFLNGYSNRAITSDPSQLSALIGNQSSPGTLFRFFYSKDTLGLTPKEAPLASRILSGQPDRYPDGIDLLAQEWYPMCDAGDNATKTEFEARMNFSRSLLSNFSKPSLVTKFHFPSGSQCNQAEFLEYMFRHKGDMVDSGLMGLIYDNWNNTAAGGYLDNPFASQNGKAGTPFCAVQNHSKLVMGLNTLTYGQKIIADNQTCMCQPCDATAIAMGTCDRQIVQQDSLPQGAVPYQICNDGQHCQMPAGYTNYSRYFCPPLCANLSASSLCSDVTGSNLSCRIDTLYRTYKTIKNFTDLDDRYWNLIAALPPQDKCFLQTPVANDTVTYTYMKKQSVTQRSELLQFPRRGEVGIDCGRTPDTSFLTYCGIDVPINQEETVCFKVG